MPHVLNTSDHRSEIQGQEKLSGRQSSPSLYEDYETSRTNMALRALSVLLVINPGNGENEEV